MMGTFITSEGESHDIHIVHWKSHDWGGRERRLVLSWAKAGKDSKGRNKATRSEGDDLGDSAARALMRMGGEDVVGEVKGVEEVGV